MRVRKSRSVITFPVTRFIAYISYIQVEPAWTSGTQITLGVRYHVIVVTPCPYHHKGRSRNRHFSPFRHTFCMEPFLEDESSEYFDFY